MINRQKLDTIIESAINKSGKELNALNNDELIEVVKSMILAVANEIPDVHKLSTDVSREISRTMRDRGR